MSDVAINIESVTKRYYIGANQSDTLRDRIASALSFTKPKREEFLALNDLTAQIKVGDVCGVIGKNGAGKSTLLKLVSRITYPTKGKIELNGKVASLLEVGTGFHPELTGRENIFLNGSILGMTRADINLKFDEILAFSGVEKFIDTPVKHYSSGMYVRLAFSVAAHLEPEILIVDEVLAVGDADFQKKCLGRMKDVSREGRTVVFVSHNISAISRLCNKGIVLKSGKKVFEGEIDEAVKTYISNSIQNHGSLKWNPTQPLVGKGISFRGIEITSDNPNGVYMTDAFQISFKLKLEETHKLPSLTFQLSTADGTLILTTSSYYQHDELEKTVSVSNQNELIYNCKIPAFFLNEGEFIISKLLVFTGDSEVLFEQSDLFSFEVNFDPKSIFGLGGRRQGVLRPLFDWEVSTD